MFLPKRMLALGGLPALPPLLLVVV